MTLHQRMTQATREAATAAGARLADELNYPQEQSVSDPEGTLPQDLAPRPIPPEQMSTAQRRQAALVMVMQAKEMGAREPSAKELAAAVPGLPMWVAYDVKKEVRGHPAVVHTKRAKRVAERIPADESWMIILDYLDAHPGTHSKRELSKATGVPESTISRLWQERMGHSFSGQPARPQKQPASRSAPAPVLQPTRWPAGGTFTIVGEHGGDILADYEGTLIRLSIKPVTGE